MDPDLSNTLQRGLQSAIEIQSRLGISQPTLSRMLSRERSAIATLGKGRSTRYALYRRIRDLEPALPVHRVSTTGESTRIGTILTIAPNVYWYEDLEQPRASAEHRSIPWFITDMQPQGYLGRFFPQIHGDLGLPERITDWSEDQFLYAIARRGEDIVGNLLIGEESLARWIALPREPGFIRHTDRMDRYATLASQTTEGGVPGSSAGGEQPKFTTITGNSSNETHHVLVKFSASQRGSDLLLAEHIASVLLNEFGHPAASTEFLRNETRSFLEVVRFDRVGLRGRLGLVSLGAMDDQFVGDRRSWPESANALLRAGRISSRDAQEIRFLSAFGSLIANTDMHFGNSSFLVEGYEEFRLAPAYDMLPMFYAPVQNEIHEREFLPPQPKPAHADQWLAALPAATEFWQRLSNDNRASEGFREIAARNARALTHR